MPRATCEVNLAYNAKCEDSLAYHFSMEKRKDILASKPSTMVTSHQLGREDSEL